MLWKYNVLLIFWFKDLKLEYREAKDSAGVFLASEGKSIGKGSWPYRIVNQGGRCRRDSWDWHTLGHHGKPTEDHAHPHRLETGRFCVIHNADWKSLSTLEAFKKPSTSSVEPMLCFDGVASTIYVSKINHHSLIGLGAICSWCHVIKDSWNQIQYMEIHDQSWLLSSDTALKCKTMMETSKNGLAIQLNSTFWYWKGTYPYYAQGNRWANQPSCVLDPSLYRWICL